MAKLPLIYKAVRLSKTYGASQNGKLLGLVIWEEVSEDLARQLIQERRLPLASECQKHGDALVLTAFLAQSIGVGRVLRQAFQEAHRGRIILYERHHRQGRAVSLFRWVDKSGRFMGKNFD